MNIQTERLENHTARLTVEVDAGRLEKAKQAAARKLSGRVAIPGFRKGKAPYRVILSYFGEPAILEDAVEILGNEIYKEALDQVDFEPYGPGSLEEFKLEPQPTFAFNVPLQPSVDLGEYRSLRLEYKAPEVTDEMVNNALKALQEREALIEESSQPVAMDNRVTVKLYGEFVGEDAPVGDDKVVIDQDESVLVLTEDREPAPGFSKALEGAVLDEEREFELTYPDDQEEYDDLAGKTVKFKATIKKIETRTLPALNDDFAARVTEKEEKPLTLLELRIRVRDNLQRSTEEQSKAEYTDEVVDQVVEKANISYPEALLNDQIDHLLEHLDGDLRQRGMTLNDFMKITGKTIDDLRKEYREPAENTLKRTLVLREILRAENIEVTDANIDETVDKIISQFGEQAETLRQLYNSPAMRDNLRNDLLRQQALDRVAAIARGEEPVVTPTTQPEEEVKTVDEVSE